MTVCPLSRSLAATYEIDFSFSSSPYLDVSVQAVPLLTLWIGVRMIRVCRTGFPHSDICGSKVICTSPQLFAAYHVFLRLLVPRHPPCALSCLISSSSAPLFLGSCKQQPRLASRRLLFAKNQDFSRSALEYIALYSSY